jgi:hypothetical protein
VVVVLILLSCDHCDFLFSFFFPFFGEGERRKKEMRGKSGRKGRRRGEGNSRGWREVKGEKSKIT